MSELSDRKQEDFGNSNFLGKQQASIRKYISCMCQAIVSSSLISWYLRQKTSFFVTFFDYDKIFNRAHDRLARLKPDGYNVNRIKYKCL